MKKVVVIGDVIEDIIVISNQERRANTDNPSSIQSTPGGSGANFAVWLASLSVETELIARVSIKDKAWDKQEHDRVLAQAFKAADEAGVRGKAVTPFLLQYIVEASGGRSLEVNLDLARNNVSLAADIAKALA